LLRHVAPGSRVVHDDWGAYRAIEWETLPFTHDVRSVVNHSKEIKNMFGEHTCHIEGVWSSLKVWLRARYGGYLPKSVSSIEGSIIEWLWRQRHAGATGPLTRQLISMVFEHAAVEDQLALRAPTEDSDTD
jgi:hypothetical protein